MRAREVLKMRGVKYAASVALITLGTTGLLADRSVALPLPDLRAHDHAAASRARRSAVDHHEVAGAACDRSDAVGVQLPNTAAIVVEAAVLMEAAPIPAAE